MDGREPNILVYIILHRAKVSIDLLPAMAQPAYELDIDKIHSIKLICHYLFSDSRKLVKQKSHQMATAEKHSCEPCTLTNPPANHSPQTNFAQNDQLTAPHPAHTTFYHSIAGPI